MPWTAASTTSVQCSRADRHVAQLARAGGRPGAVEREGEHVGGRVPSAVLAVELADPRGVDQLDRDVAVGDARRRQRRRHRVAQLGRHVGEVSRHPPPAGCSPCVRSACSP